MEKGFATRLKARREAIGLTQLALATRAGYANKTSISMLEASKAECPLNKAKIIADILEVDVNWLLYGNGEPPITNTTETGLSELEREIVRLCAGLSTSEKIDLINDLRNGKYGESSKQA